MYVTAERERERRHLKVHAKISFLSSLTSVSACYWLIMVYVDVSSRCFSPSWMYRTSSMATGPRFLSAWANTMELSPESCSRVDL